MDPHYLIYEPSYEVRLSAVRGALF